MTRRLDLTADEAGALAVDGRCAIVRPAGELTCFTRTTIRPDAPFAFADRVSAKPGIEHRLDLNPRGAVSAVLAGGKMLGLKPREFDFVCPLAEGRTYLDGCWHIDVLDGAFEYAGGRARIVSVVLMNGNDGWCWHADAEAVS